MVPSRSPRRSTRQALRNAVQVPYPRPRDSPRTPSASSLSSISVPPSSSPDPLAPTPKKRKSMAIMDLEKGSETLTDLAGESSKAAKDDQTSMTQADKEELRDIGRAVKRRKISHALNGDAEDDVETSTAGRTTERRSTTDQLQSPSVDLSTKRQRTRSHAAQPPNPAITPRNTRSRQALPSAVAAQSSPGRTEKRLISLTSPKPYKPSLSKMMSTPVAERVEQEMANGPSTQSQQPKYPVSQKIDGFRPARNEEAEPTSSANTPTPGPSSSIRHPQTKNLTPVLAREGTSSPSPQVFSSAVPPPRVEPMADMRELKKRTDLLMDVRKQIGRTKTDGVSADEVEEIAKSEQVLEDGNGTGLAEDTSMGDRQQANRGLDGHQMEQVDHRNVEISVRERVVAGRSAQDISSGVLQHPPLLATGIPTAWQILPPMTGVISQEAVSTTLSCDSRPFAGSSTTFERLPLPDFVTHIYPSSGPTRPRPTHDPPSGRRPSQDAPERRNHLQSERRAVKDKVAKEGLAPAPMRVRRSGQLSGGQNKMLETMIVGCFERAYEALLHPPANLPIIFTTAPFDPSSCTRKVPSWWTETPPSMRPEASQPRKNNKFREPTEGPMITIRAVGGGGTVTVPSWRMVNESDDIAESNNKSGRTTRGARGGGRDADENLSEPEDMTDEYYERMHHRYERAEVQARLREQEVLQSERYHLKQRLDLLRGMTAQVWSSHVARITEMNRPTLGGKPDSLPDSQAEPAGSNAEASGSNAYLPETKHHGAVWLEAAEKLLEDLGVDGVRERLIEEGVELLKKYDRFLPQRIRDVVSTPRAGSHASEGVEQPRAESWDTRSRKSTPRSDVQLAAPNGRSSSKQMRVAVEAAETAAPSSSSTPARQPRAKRQPPSKLALGVQASDQVPSTGEISAASTLSAFEPYVPITTESGKPVLQEAVDRRLQIMLLAAEQVENGKPTAEDGPRGRASARSALIHPFGVPISGQAAKKDPFNLDGAVWLPIIEERLQGKGWFVVMDPVTGLRAVKMPVVSSSNPTAPSSTEAAPPSSQAAAAPSIRSGAHGNGIMEPINGLNAVKLPAASVSKVAIRSSSGPSAAPATSSYLHAPIPPQPLQVQSPTSQLAR